MAMVVAVDRYTAEDAAELVVDYDQLPPVVDYATALEPTESIHASHPGNLVGELAGRPMADLAPVFERAPHVVSVTVHQQSYGPVPMETRGIVAEWSAPAGEMTIWAATQSPHEVRSFCARLLGVDEHRVRVVMRDTGGGFGQKMLPQREDMCVMLAAVKLPAALKWIEDRQEHLLAAGQARHERVLGQGERAPAPRSSVESPQPAFPARTLPSGVLHGTTRSEGSATPFRTN
ncbi:molybdopterin cofactor-binding domain-containing protein [Streptomyces sp. NPDC086519]|uniref:molybdopterin cofactor-binding domain-containing protein n=1 Tax=Streptomyces sp. NPDC086519 TaxID=3154863 RepID=UPI003441947D